MKQTPLGEEPMKTSGGASARNRTEIAREIKRNALGLIREIGPLALLPAFADNVEVQSILNEGGQVTIMLKIVLPWSDLSPGTAMTSRKEMTDLDLYHSLMEPQRSS